MSNKYMWLIGTAVLTNLLQDRVASSIENNSDFQYKLGMSPKIVRTSSGKCCKWCDAVAGTYEYPNVPKDAYRRHKNCNCTIEYDPGNGKRRSIRSKRSSRIKIDDTTEYMGNPKIYTTKLNGKSAEIKTYKNDKYSNIWCQTNTKNSREMCEYLNDKINKTGSYGQIENIVVAKNSSLRGIAAYDYNKGTLYISEELIDTKAFYKLVDKNYFAASNIDDVLMHELGGHKKHWDSVKNYYNKNKQRLHTIENAKQELETNLRKYITDQSNNDHNYIKSIISKNASDQYFFKKLLNEIIADGIIRVNNKTLNDSYLAKLIEEVIEHDGNAK